jgi:ATP/maltotriose-dependent transcriptional regulator MalT
LRAVDLRFTPDEASLLLREAIGVELPAASVAALETSVLDRLSGGLCDAVTLAVLARGAGSAFAFRSAIPPSGWC